MSNRPISSCSPARWQTLMASLLVRGTNEFLVSGECGALRLCEPFFCADRYDVRSYAAQGSARGKSRQGRTPSRKFLRRLRQSHSLKLLWRRLSRMKELLRRKQIRSFPFAGNGLPV